MDYAKHQLDIYIDSARFLPDNCSITKLVVRIVDVNNKDLIPKSEVMADIATSFVRT